jgi:hypothetical protein
MSMCFVAGAEGVASSLRCARSEATSAVHFASSDALACVYCSGASRAVACGRATWSCRRSRTLR